MKKTILTFISLTCLTVCLAAEKPNSVLIVGAQFGDEGKGKIVDYLSQEAQTIVRSQGGNNAGHTVVIGDDEYQLHLIPSGILQDQANCYLAGGVVIDPKVLLEEMQKIKAQGVKVEGKLWVSPYAHVIMPYHRLYDGLSEKSLGNGAIGTTKRGIGPAYADKANRKGITMGQLMDAELFREMLKRRIDEVNQELVAVYGEKPLNFEEIYREYSGYARLLKPYVKENVEEEIDQDIRDGKRVVFEGAQGTFLDNTFGTVPFVTSSSTIAGGISSGAGIGPNKVGHVLAIVKAYQTRVGNGPMPTEVNDEKQFDAKKSREFGVTTGRKRRMGWFDAVMVNKAVVLNGADSMALMKLDILDDFETIKICTAYEIDGKVYRHLPSNEKLLERAKPMYEEMPGWMQSTTSVRSYDELPENAKRYIARLQELCRVPVSILSVGPDRNQTLILRKI